MTSELTLLAAVLTGLLSSTHCLGMCGGIAGSFGLSTGGAPARTLGFSLLFNGGRVLSYTIAGAIVGAAGLWTGKALALGDAAALLRVLTGLILVGVGLQLTFNWQGLRHLERFGGGLWRRLQPVTRKLLPVRSPRAALALGLLWGWLPCGLVYTMLLAAATLADPVDSALLMLAYGAGTLPAMVTAATAAQTLRKLVRHPVVRKAGGILLLGFGIWTAALPLIPHGGRDGHAAAPTQ
jgi:sulfite exporter TauE/SafE